MTIEETVKNTPLDERPFINDTPGKPAHPMTDEQYTEYLRMQEEQANQSPPQPSPEQEIAELKRQNEEMRRMIEALASGETGVTA